MKIRKVMTAVMVAALVGLVTASGASAADDTNVTVIGGSLSVTNMTVADFANVTLDGTARTTTASASDFTVTDARGTGAGWNVTVSGTQFCKLDTLGVACDLVTPRNLPTSSLSVPQLSVAKADATSSAVPSLTGGPYLVDGLSVKVASSAANGTGMGSYDFSQGGNWNLTVPASAYAGSYRSTVTVSVASGP